MINIKKGLDLPISGAPDQTISEGKPVRHVALIGFDYNGMKPTMEVKEGDRVKRGSLLFTDKKTEGVRYTSPAAGVVKEINRGERRVFQSIVIEIDGDEAETFARYSEGDLASLERQQVWITWWNPGLWTAFRTRPFSKVPAIDSAPNSIFVSVMDTNPLAADPVVIIKEQAAAFEKGLQILTRLTNGKVFVTGKPGSDVPVPKSDAVQVEQFDGVHPAGNVGTHIHYLDPVSLSKTVWSIGYQDVIAIAKLFETGELPVDRVVAIGGPKANNPRLVRTAWVPAWKSCSKMKPLLTARSVRSPVRYSGDVAVPVPAPTWVVSITRSPCSRKATSAISWAGCRRAPTSSRC